MTQAFNINLDFPRYHGDPCCSGVIRTVPDDFQVDEDLGFELSGSGEHYFLQIRKRGENTQWLVNQLARITGVRPHDVGYAGLKDRHANTTQWFSVWLPGKNEPQWQQLETPSVEILQICKHSRKLKRGGHRANRFKLMIRQLQLSGDLEDRLQQIKTQGVPNYYGEQRFGHHGGNLDQAERLFNGEIRVKDRQRRGLYLSAARSYLFNKIVAARVEASCFDHYLGGDRLMIDGTSNLSQESDIQQLEQLVTSMQLHPTAPLYGRGRSLVEAECLALETDILAANKNWCDGLEAAGMRPERRSVRLPIPGLSWSTPELDTLQLSFELPPGTFATSVLRECCDYQVENAVESDSSLQKQE
ncbi:MAG: tRNA pseudouridine(13) synthase TruD [Motiliproteus sp.]